MALSRMGRREGEGQSRKLEFNPVHRSLLVAAAREIDFAVPVFGVAPEFSREGADDALITPDEGQRRREMASSLSL